MRSLWVCMCCVVWLFSSGCQESSSPGEAQFSVSIVDRGELPRQLSDKVVYHYTFGTAKPESLITLLLQQDIPAVEAWFPLDNLCLGPIGAQFTVLLSSNEERIKDFGFREGEGRLECSTSLRYFVIRK